MRKWREKICSFFTIGYMEQKNRKNLMKEGDVRELITISNEPLQYDDFKGSWILIIGSLKVERILDKQCNSSLRESVFSSRIKLLFFQITLKIRYFQEKKPDNSFVR